MADGAAAAAGAGAAHCAIGGYGGGLLGGDVVELEVEVEAGAALLLTTQASTKVYRTKRDGIAATQSLNATVDDGGLLVLAPDPVVPYESAAYEQRQRFMLSPAASLVAVDWVGAGRVSRGERWAFSHFASRNEVLRRPEAGAAPAKAVAVDAMRLSGGAGLLGLDLGRVEYDTVVSVLCSGEEAAPVAERLRMLSSALAHRRVGQRPGVLRAALVEEVSEPAAAAARALLGNVVVGVGVAQGSAAPKGGGGSGGGAGAGALDVVIARLAAEHAEDVFRLLHFAMAPLAPRLGASPYGLRIHADVAALCPIKAGAAAAAAAAAPPPPTTEAARATSSLAAPLAPALSIARGLSIRAPGGNGWVPVQRAISAAAGLPPGEEAPPPPPLALSPRQRARMAHLSDATLPTGGFAHSGGLEAASQLGLLGGGDEAVRRFTRAATHSTATLLAPFAAGACSLFSSPVGKEGPSPAQWREWEALDTALHAQLSANGPARRASAEQGRALSRVGAVWLRQEAAARDLCAAFGDRGANPNRAPHGATMLGALCALLGLPPQVAAEVIAYTTARDVLSAAVRLNLVGPLAAVEMQADVAEEAAAAAAVAAQRGVANAASSAPLLEAMHPCHDLLDRRIFRT